MDHTQKRVQCLSPKLHELMAQFGADNVYFQPPESVKIVYPCVVYREGGESVRHADNKRYNAKRRYVVTFIDRDPDSRIPECFSNRFIYSSLVNKFTLEGLNHWVYDLYF